MASQTRTKTAKTAKTARPARPERAARAEHDRVNAETRTDNAAKASDDATEQLPDDQQATAGNRTEPQHAEHPESSTDSTVRHAEPQTGKQAGEGEGGFPTGEYDVTSPAPAQAEAFRGALDTHLEGVDQERLDAILGDAVLDADELQAALEAMPVGFMLIKEGNERWRAHLTGTQRFGHGNSATLATEAFVTGTSSLTLTDAAAREFLRLPKAQQQEIRDRDEAARNAVSGQGGGTDPVEESRRTMAKRMHAELAQPGATDGPEQASASQNTSRAAKKTAAGQSPSAKKATKRSSRSKK